MDHLLAIPKSQLTQTLRLGGEGVLGRKIQDTWTLPGKNRCLGGDTRVPAARERRKMPDKSKALFEVGLRKS